MVSADVKPADVIAHDHDDVELHSGKSRGKRQRPKSHNSELDYENIFGLKSHDFLQFQLAS
jgi:hypothetical protein